jgi:6-pyruvoyl-tetrahydropterin synthase
MMYHREFMISSCHFNGEDTYKLYRLLLHPESATEEQRQIKIMLMLGKVLEGIHGHNFRIVVEIEDNLVPSEGYMVDDVAIERVVMQWNNTNLSVHKDFTSRQWRATTENMAYVLVRKISRLLLRDYDGSTLGPVVSVYVHETDDIYANEAVFVADLIHEYDQEHEDDEEACL